MSQFIRLELAARVCKQRERENEIAFVFHFILIFIMLINAGFFMNQDKRYERLKHFGAKNGRLFTPNSVFKVH